MVRTLFRLAAPCIVVVCLAACEIFTVTPFPGFTMRTDVSINLGSRIDAVAAGKTPISYDLAVVDDAGQPPRVLLLVEPPSSDPDVGFNYTGQLIFMDKDLNVVGQAATAKTTDYFSKPYSYAHDGNILAGYSVLTPDGGTTGITLLPTGMEGFAFTVGPETYLYSTPAGQYAGFDISFLSYLTTVPPQWGIDLQHTLQIIPTAARPSPTDQNYANLGYQLVGLAYDPVTTNITFVLSEPAQGRIVAARMSFAQATTGTGPLLNVASWPVDASAWPMAVTVDRPELHADSGGFFMVQRDGWMTRYNWDTSGGSPTIVGSPQQIVGDRSLSRHYAFLNSPTGGQFMYRFDPSSRVLTRYTRWW
jgi:hypothetical protein